jgi:hypothetical protein
MDMTPPNFFPRPITEIRRVEDCERESPCFRVVDGDHAHQHKHHHDPEPGSMRTTLTPGTGALRINAPTV